MKSPPRTLAERIESRIIKDESGCWLWTGACNSGGYGYIKVSGKQKSVHRVSWELTNGLIPKGLCICHRCDIRNCINPEHLFIGTYKDNSQDMVKKGRRPDIAPWRHKTHCKRGHPLSGDNIYRYIIQGSKRRQCKTCHRIRRANYKRKANG